MMLCVRAEDVRTPRHLPLSGHSRTANFPTTIARAYGTDGMARMYAMSEFISCTFIFVGGMLPLIICLLWCRRRLFSVGADSMEAVPASPGAAAVPCRPPTPWQVWHE